MSSLDSALNSLSAATWEDIVIKLLPRRSNSLTDRKKITYSRLITLFWGVLVIIFAYCFSHSSETVIELVNKIGSAFYGPIAAVFILGILSYKFTSIGILWGLLTGVSSNIFLWIFHSQSVSWLWWNFSGFLVTSLIAFSFSLFTKTQSTSFKQNIFSLRKNSKFILILLILFFLILLSLILLEKSLQ
jgi:Na+(H+)/acetate symporter ActP